HPLRKGGQGPRDDPEDVLRHVNHRGGGGRGAYPPRAHRHGLGHDGRADGGAVARGHAGGGDRPDRRLSRRRRDRLHRDVRPRGRHAQLRSDGRARVPRVSVLSGGERTPTLYVFAGLPGSGKTTLSQLLARRIGATHLRIDTIEQALRDLCALDVQGEGYRLSYRIAADNLRLGLDVVADSCNPIELTRDEWRRVALDASARA